MAMAMAFLANHSRQSATRVRPYLLRHPRRVTSCSVAPSAFPFPTLGSGSLRSHATSTASQNNGGGGDAAAKHATRSDAERSRTPNANPNEVDKFSSFASNWWDSRSNPLVGMNPVRVKFMRDIAAEFQPPSDRAASGPRPPMRGKRILDIGCGGGLMTESLSRLGASLVVGLDASSAVVEAAKVHSFHGDAGLNLEQRENHPCDLERENIRYIGGMTVEELATHWLSEREKERTLSANESANHELFDVVTALEVIEHVPEPASLLHAATQLLKPGGVLFVSTINRTMKSYGLAIIAAEYITGKVPVGTHDWNQFRSPAEVERMVRSDDSRSSSSPMAVGKMKQIGLSGMVLKPPFVDMQWTLDGEDVDVNWIGAYQKQMAL